MLFSYPLMTQDYENKTVPITQTQPIDANRYEEQIMNIKNKLENCKINFKYDVLTYENL